MRVCNEFDFVLTHLEWLQKEFESPVDNQQGKWEDKREILHHFSSVLANCIFSFTAEELFSEEELLILRDCYSYFLKNGKMDYVISKLKGFKNYEYSKYN